MARRSGGRPGIAVGEEDQPHAEQIPVAVAPLLARSFFGR